MSNHTLAKRYALALFSKAEQTNIVSEVDSDVSLLRETLSSSRELTQLFKSPVVSKEKKHSILKRLLETKVSSLFLDFLNMLVEKGREDVTDDILKAYQAMRDEQQGIVEATIKVAFDLDPSTTQNLKLSLEKITGKKVRINMVKEENLIGGMVVRIGDKVYDGSVKRQLESLRQQLVLGTPLSN